MREYDESHIAQIAGALDQSARTAFAAACAERLWPLIERYAATAAKPQEFVWSVRALLDTAWSGARGEVVDLEPVATAAEAMIPDEDDDWVVETGYAQNAIAAVAFAARVWLSSDAQEAVWAARQVYEAAYLGMEHDPDPQGVHSGVVDQSDDAPLVRSVVAVIFEDLESAGRDSADEVRARVEAASAEFSQFFP